MEGKTKNNLSLHIHVYTCRASMVTGHTGGLEIFAIMKFSQSGSICENNSRNGHQASVSGGV